MSVTTAPTTGARRRAHEDSRAEAVARLVCELGRELGVTVIAEGVETEEQLSFLRRIGYGLGQGFLLGSPQPRESALEYLA